jgi:hypothetical protein
MLVLLLFTVHYSLSTAFPQQPQAQAGQEIFPVNAKFVQGVGPGYWPTAGSNLTLNLAPGTAVCSNVVQTYAGGTLTLAPSATNYVYLDASHNCAPASNSTGFTAATIPIATVVTTSTAISSITDVRTMFVSGGATSSGSVSSVGMAGDGIIFNPTVFGSPITSSGTLTPQLLTQTAKTILAGPGSGPAATPTFRALAAADLPASLTSSTSGNAATASALASSPTQCGSNNWATGISTSGNANCLQPGFSNLAGSLGLGQTPLTTAGDLLFANSTPALARLPIGGTNQFLGISGGLPAWFQPTFSNLSGTATISQGGTGQTTTAAAFNALSPLTTEGDLHYYHSSSNTRLAIGGANTFLTSNGTDPSWGSLTGAGFGSQTANNVLAAPNGSSGNPFFRSLVAADLPASITSSTSGNAATATALATAPSQCTGSAFALGVAASGNANCIGTQTANTVYAAPNGSSGAPTFRALVGSDLPTIAISGGGTGQTTANAGFNALSPLTTEGDTIYYHSSANTRLGAGSNGQCLTSNGTDPVWGSCSGSSNLAWSTLVNPTANLTLSMSTYATTFNHTSAVNWTWANTTAATSGTPQSSPLFNLSGTYWNGSASATDSWSLQDVVASGTNGNSTLTLAHSGSSGTATLSVPNLTNTSTTQYGVLYGGGSSSPVKSTAAGTSGLPLLGQGSTAPAFGTLGIAGGGTGQTTAAAAFNTLSPLSTEGDFLFYHSSANTRLGVGTNGQCLTSNGTDPVWGSCSTGAGTVTSVGLSLPSLFSVSGSPVTGSGTLTAALANQNANFIMAGPTSGSAAAPSFRTLVGADLPVPTTSTLGGVESVTCTSGQFLNQISTGGVPACAAPSGGGSSSGLGNGSTVIDASLQAGTDFGSKVNAAIAALPSTGGTVDARGLGGSQSMSENIVMSPNVTLLLGAVTLTESPGMGIKVSYGDAIKGLSTQASVITGNGTSPMIYQDTTVNAAYLTLANFTVGNYINAVNNPPNYPLPNDMAIYLPQASEGTFVNLYAYASYGFYYGSKTGLRPDLPLITGCNCYSHFQGNNFLGWITGLTVGWNANSNGFYDNIFGGLQSGTAVYVDTGAFSNYFWHSDEEVQNLGFDIYGQDTFLDSTYMEEMGLRSDAPTWTASYAYVGGEIIKDSNGNEQKCVVGGTSGSSAPTWATAAGAQTTDNGAIWQRVVNSGGVFEASSINTVISGGGHLSSSLFDNLTLNIPMFSTHAQAQFPALGSGSFNSSNGQILSGGVNTGAITLSEPPTLSYHLAGGTHTTTYYYYVNLNTGVSASGYPLGQTGLSPQATISNAPDVLGQVETATIANGGVGGYAVNDTITLNCYTTGTAPVLKMSSVSSGVVTGVTISNAGTSIASGTCGQASTSGSGTGFQAAVDSNYIIITPPTVNIPGVGTTVFQYPGGGSWDIVGRTNVSNVTIGSYGQGIGVTLNNFWPSAGTFCDLGWPTVAYNVPARNTTGDFTVGASNGGATISHLLNNYFDTFANPSTNTPAYFAYQFTPHLATGNGGMDFLLTPEGTGNESSYCLAFNSDAAAAHTFCATTTSSGLTIGGLNGNNLPVNIPALVVPTPMTTLGDLLYGGASGALTRLAGNTSTTPMYLKSLGAAGAATAPTLAQIQFSDVAGTLGISSGGTGQSTAATAFNALSPLTTEGDLHYYHSSSNTRLAIGGANTFLTSNGTDPSWGSLTGAGFGSQTANTFLAAPSGSSGNPSFRTLVAADLPASLTSNTSGNAATATALAATPTQCSGNNFATGVAASGNANCSQPAFINLSGSLALSQTPLTTSGDLLYANSTPALARLPIGSTNQFLGVSSGSPAWVQPSFSNLSGSVATSQLPTVPVADGGTGQTSFSAGLLRSSGSALSSAELSGDCTTSGSNAITCTKANGGAYPASAFFLGTNSSSQPVSNQPFVVNAQTATYQVLASDFTACKTIPVASGTFTITLVASTSQPPSGQCLDIINYGTGVVTIARSGQNINGGTASLTVAAGTATAPTGAHVVSDGTNYEAALWGGGNGSLNFPLTVGGTANSGGIPYFSSATTLTSSAALTSYGVLFGGGAGGAPTSSAAGTSGQLLNSGGSSANGSYKDLVNPPLIIPAANCNNATAGTGWSLPTSAAPTAACRTGTHVQGGVLQFAQSNTAQFQIDIPGNWDSSSTVYAKIYFTQGANTTASQTIIMLMATGCSSTTDDPAFNTAQAFGTATTTSTANTPFTETLSSVTMTGCSAGGNMNVEILRSASDTATTSPNVYWVSLTFQSLNTAGAN